eukprot:TRINITY_DN22224_c0_g1_i1.p1 TRINITY_DN22224_c0_g1~~TRINITY_DN22224_c0_g1_i1.p1  ORF type:complete len:1039 (-),score=158.27 TRINITY_DN22224_c0_g1_i1:261-3377(-)
MVQSHAEVGDIGCDRCERKPKRASRGKCKVIEDTSEKTLRQSAAPKDIVGIGKKDETLQLDSCGLEPDLVDIGWPVVSSQQWSALPVVCAVPHSTSHDEMNKVQIPRDTLDTPKAASTSVLEQLEALKARISLTIDSIPDSNCGLQDLALLPPVPGSESVQVQRSDVAGTPPRKSIPKIDWLEVDTKQRSTAADSFPDSDCSAQKKYSPPQNSNRQVRRESSSDSNSPEWRIRRMRSRSRSRSWHDVRNLRSSVPSRDSGSRNPICSTEREGTNSGNTLVLTFTPCEAAFLTNVIHKIARASGVRTQPIKMNRMLQLEGSAVELHLAKKYVGFTLAQMSKVVRLRDEDIDDDCCLIQVPADTVAGILGSGGKNLRMLEDEWGVLMFLAEYDGVQLQPVKGERSCRHELLAIVGGQRRGRRGAQLCIMSQIELKHLHIFSSKIRSSGELYETPAVGEDYGTTTFKIPEHKFPYAIGKHEQTRLKIMTAAGCILQYIGPVAMISGTKAEQRRGHEYLSLWLEKLDGPIIVHSAETRSDATVIDIPASMIAYVTGSGGAHLKRVEDQWGVLLTFLGNHGRHGEPLPDRTVQLVIFSISARARCGAELDIKHAVDFQVPGFFSDALSEWSSDHESFDVERLRLDKLQAAYVSGVRGSTVKKIAAASGAIAQFVGVYCCVGGCKAERQRCKDYIGFLLQKMADGYVVIDTSQRTDCTTIPLGFSSKAPGIVTGKDGHVLHGVADETGTWCLVARDDRGSETLFIFGDEGEGRHCVRGRRRAAKLFRGVLKHVSHVYGNSPGHDDDCWQPKHRTEKCANAETHQVLKAPGARWADRDDRWKYRDEPEEKHHGESHRAPKIPGSRWASEDSHWQHTDELDRVSTGETHRVPKAPGPRSAQEDGCLQHGAEPETSAREEIERAQTKVDSRSDDEDARWQHVHESDQRIEQEQIHAWKAPRTRMAQGGGRWQHREISDQTAKDEQQHAWKTSGKHMAREHDNWQFSRGSDTMLRRQSGSRHDAGDAGMTNSGTNSVLPPWRTWLEVK